MMSAFSGIWIFSSTKEKRKAKSLSELVVGTLCLSLFCCAFLCVHSSFAITLKRKRKLVALLLLSCGCLVKCKYSVTLSQGALGWSAYYLIILTILNPRWENF